MCVFEDGADGLVLSELLASFPCLFFFFPRWSRWTSERTEEVTDRGSEVGEEEESEEDISHRTRIAVQRDRRGGGEGWKRAN